MEDSTTDDATYPNITVSLNYNDLGFTLAVCGLAVVIIQLLFFSVSIICKADKVKDVAGGICFVTVACVSLLLDKHKITWETHKRQIVTTVFVCSWAIRLAGFLFARHIRMGQDYQPTNTNTCCKHVAYWVFQIIWVFVVSLPVMCMNSSEMYEHADLWTNYDIAGTTVFLIGAVGEFIADQQKFNWKFNRINRGMWVTFGLWGWSRHPNYFFEIVTWLGVFVLSCNVLQGIEWLSVLSPVFVVFILLFVSGLPVVEATADAKYGKYEEYRRYKKGTSVLIPIHPWLYRFLPQPIRCTLLLDFPLYNHLQDEDQPAGESLTQTHTQV